MQINRKFITLRLDTTQQRSSMASRSYISIATIPETENDVAGTESLDNGVDPIRQAIEHQILGGEFAPGDRLNELAMARTLGVSRGIIREAVRLLEQAGLVVVVRNHGVFVRKLSLEEVLDLYDVRAGLAHVVGRLVTTRITKDELDGLTRTFERMEEFRQAHDASGYEKTHAEFHAAILSITRNPTLIGFHRQIDKQMRLFLRSSVVSLARLRRSNSFHKRILAQIEEGDGDKVGRALEADVMHGKERLLDSLTSRRS